MTSEDAEKLKRLIRNYASDEAAAEVYAEIGLSIKADSHANKSAATWAAIVEIIDANTEASDVPTK